MPSLRKRTRSVKTTPHDQNSGEATPGLWVLGLGTQYPSNTFLPEDLDSIANRHYDTDKEGLSKLLAINRKTGIQTRSTVLDLKQGFVVQPKAPTVVELDNNFRDVGVNLAAWACEKALEEAGLRREDITHTVAVTCTNQGNPGYDLLVHEQLGLRPDVDRSLLHGVGCAGGLSIMRAAAQMALAATARGRPARVLAFACELCTPNVRNELAAAERCSAKDVCVAAALFSDAAAAFVLANDLGRGNSEAKFRLRAFDSAVLPGTIQQMSFYSDHSGSRTVLAKAIPQFTTVVVKRLFGSLVREYSACFGHLNLEPSDFDWVLHPGGEAIIQGVQSTMSLTDKQLKASRYVYRTRGNSSSPTVLIVLDLLRDMGEDKDHVVATSFGPGLSVEMAMLERCRHQNLL